MRENVQGSRHGPGGEAMLQSFGDDAKIAIGCVVDQKGDSKEAAEVGIVSLRNLLISICPDCLSDRRPGHCGSGEATSSQGQPVTIGA